MKFYLKLGIAASLLLFFSACKEKGNDEPSKGKLAFGFVHLVDGSPLETDTAIYLNAAGNRYMVTEVQYFISDVTLYRHDGTVIMIESDNSIHYVDNDILSTMGWMPADAIPDGEYDSLSFTFGISEAKNISNMYTDPPESLMFWPEMLGGGYHYLKMNGKWVNTDEQMTPFNFHLGIGQTYDNEHNITGFIQNYFKVHIPVSSFTVNKDQTTYLTLNMNIESWFDTPNVYDFNYWGGAIMQNQAAMQAACENGADAFSIGTITIQ